MKAHRIISVLFSMAWIVACNTPAPEPETTPSGLTQTPLISECGGFVKQTKTDPPQPDASTYCEAERLLWAYDSGTGSLGLTNARIMLNCCGEHSIEVTEDGGTYVISERDAPEKVDGMEAR